MKITKRDLQRCEMLLEIARDIEPSGCARIAAGLYIKNDLISVGWNHQKSAPFYAKYGKNEEAIYAHAETHAINKAIKIVGEEELKNSRTSLYVVRAKRESQYGDFIPGLARPCSGCQECISDFNIRKIMFSLDVRGYERWDISRFN